MGVDRPVQNLMLLTLGVDRNHLKSFVLDEGCRDFSVVVHRSNNRPCFFYCVQGALFTFEGGQEKHINTHRSQIMAFKNI